jgi:HEAT repeat protein
VEQALFDLDVSVPGNRKWIAGKLARMEPAPAYRERVAGALHPLLDDPDLFTRSAAANALGVWGTAESVPLLIERLEDREHSVRWATLEALGKLKDLRAAEPVAQLLHRGDRGFASQALQAMGPLAAPAAVRRLKDPEWTVRIEACRILKAVGSREQEPALREVLREDSGLVAMAAEEALRVILSRRPSPDP